MREERHWLAVVPTQRYADERRYAYDALALPGVLAPSGDSPALGDSVALIAATNPPVLFGLGVVAQLGSEAGKAVGEPAGARGDGISVSYTRRLFDDPLPLRPPHLAPVIRPGHYPPPPGLYRVTAAAFQRLVAQVANRRADASASGWFVSVTLPIEASSRAEAVREFWTYMRKLGPRELPAYVWPRGDELAMQAYLLGEPANLDPEEDDEGE